MTLTQRRILLFWAPLAATWVMMAAEGPFLAAVIARLADPKFNLAAHGVAFAFAILVEAPVIMLMSAATALVEDADSYRRMRTFMLIVSGIATSALVVLLLPPVFGPLLRDVLGLPEEVARLAHLALWFYLPWPAAIGIRRFLQGVLIRAGRPRLVAIGTVIRLVVMASGALLLAVFTPLPGVAVGGAALSLAVVVEAVVARWMARGTIRELCGGMTLAEGGGEPAEAADGAADGREGERLTYRGIVAFYIPLALTSLIGLAVQPMLTFFMGRSVLPVESLAVFPVVNSLSFVFRALGLAYQDAALALLGPARRHRPEIGRFTLTLGLAATAGLAAIAFTPLAQIWFEVVSGLSTDLAQFAYAPTRLAVPIAGFSVLLGYQRALLMKVRHTRPITIATAVETLVIAVAFSVASFRIGMVGATAAFLALTMGRIAATATLTLSLRSSRRADVEIRTRPRE